MSVLRLDRMPTVAAVMTPSPHFVQPDDPVEAIERIMAEHGVRHVPVTQEGRVVGIVTKSDLGRLVNPALPRVDKQHIRARSILRRDPYLVETSTPLAQVAAEMAQRKVGSAIVTKGGQLAGVLSVVDLCRTLAELLEARFGPDSDTAP